MTDDLRDRIAAVLVGGCPCFDCTAVALEKADVLIAELGLRREHQQCASVGGGYSQWHRYVTEWTADE